MNVDEKIDFQGVLCYNILGMILSGGLKLKSNAAIELRINLLGNAFFK